MTDADLIKNLREILKQEPHDSIQFSELFEFIAQKWDSVSPTKEAKVRAITTYIKTVLLKSEKITRLLVCATERRQLVIMFEVFTGPITSTTAAVISGIAHECQQEINRLSQEMERLQQDAHGELVLLRNLLGELKRLGCEESLELPNVCPHYPRLF